VLEKKLEEKLARLRELAQTSENLRAQREEAVQELLRVDGEVRVLRELIAGEKKEKEVKEEKE